MQIKIYRLFVPVAVWYTRRSDITLQREMNLAEGVPAPMTAEELRRLIDTGQAAPAERGSFCVQFGGGGHYFDDRRAALAYLCTRWGGEFIMRHLDDAVERAKAYISGALGAMLDLGRGSGPMDHMFARR